MHGDASSPFSTGTEMSMKGIKMQAAKSEFTTKPKLMEHKGKGSLHKEIARLHNRAVQRVGARFVWQSALCESSHSAGVEKDAELLQQLNVFATLYCPCVALIQKEENLILQYVSLFGTLLAKKMVTLTCRVLCGIARPCTPVQFIVAQDKSSVTLGNIVQALRSDNLMGYKTPWGQIRVAAGEDGAEGASSGGATDEWISFVGRVRGGARRRRARCPKCSPRFSTSWRRACSSTS